MEAFVRHGKCLLLPALGKLLAIIPPNAVYLGSDEISRVFQMQQPIYLHQKSAMPMTNTTRAMTETAIMVVWDAVTPLELDIESEVGLRLADVGVAADVIMPAGLP